MSIIHRQTCGNLKIMPLCLDSESLYIPRKMKAANNSLTLTGLALFAIRIKATDELSGTVDSFSCIVHSKAKDWNGAAWVETTTSNPAKITVIT